MAVLFGEHLRCHGRRNCVGNFFLSRPDVLQEDVVTLLVFAQCLMIQIDIHCAGDCVRDNQRGTCQVIGLHQRIDSTFKVSIP